MVTSNRPESIVHFIGDNGELFLGGGGAYAISSSAIYLLKSWDEISRHLD
jgi:hypothetical protein